MKIRDYVVKCALAEAKKRREDYIRISGPQCIIENLAKRIAELEQGVVKVGGDNSLLDYEFENKELKKGRGGVPYVQFDGKINYFPYAQHGKYIVAVSK